jgi:hypothetical protein
MPVQGGRAARRLATGNGDAVAVSLHLYLYREGAAELPDTVSPFLAERFGGGTASEPGA